MRTLVAGEPFRGCASLPLETDVTERLPVGVADGEQGVRFIDGPRRDRNGRGGRSLAPSQDAQPSSRPLAAGGIMNWKSAPYGVAGLAQSFPP